ncbi:MAG: hypothetical protein ABJN75_12330 [Hoeflea sp.]|uniref:hypothetical protein n=1 Tax=Hoeflea sp. TaxID=1940281 RepID=UPI0032976192
MARSLFGNARCGRIPYALIVLAILAADFLKTPLEAYVGSLHSNAMERLVSDTVANPATVVAGPLPMRETAQQMRLHLEEVYSKRLREYQAHKAEFPDSDRAAPVMMDREVASQWALRQPGLALMPTTAQLQHGESLSAGMTTLNSLYVTAIGLIGLASMVAIAWVVLARVRDIGWPAWAGLAILGVFIIKIWTLQTVPTAVSTGLQVIFLALLMGLALIPAGFDPRRKPQPAEARMPVPGPVRDPASPRAAARRQFGRRAR